MGSITRHQEYRYQYKTISMNNAITCGQGGTLNFNLPANVLEIKNLWAHIRVRFDAAEPVDNRKISGIGQVVWPFDSPQPKVKPLALVADGNRRIDFTADLTEILDTLEVTGVAAFAQGFIGVGIRHPNNLTKIAIVEIWKMDLVYTTQGIR